MNTRNENFCRCARTRTHINLVQNYIEAKKFLIRLDDFISAQTIHICMVQLNCIVSLNMLIYCIVLYLYEINIFAN